MPAHEVPNVAFWDSFGEFWTIVAALLIVLDPFAVVPVFVALAGRMEARDVRRLTYKVIGGATILLLFFTITGVGVLRLFRVTLDDLRIGGGLLLLIIAIKMVIEGSISGKDGDYQAVVVPLISPLLVGPGAITASVVLGSIHGIWLTAAAATAAMLVSLLILLCAGFLHRLIGTQGADLVTRIMGVLIATIAVSYIRVGVQGYFNT